MTDQDRVTGGRFHRVARCGAESVCKLVSEPPLAKPRQLKDRDGTEMPPTAYREFRLFYIPAQELSDMMTSQAVAKPFLHKAPMDSLPHDTAS